ncbi:MAG: S9 family peptidase [Acidobacteria bacterium]|nr:S9 family peptidase [Acidobacteriota bacterium]
MTNRTAALLALSLAAGSGGLFAQAGSQQASGYLVPPKAIVDIMDAEPLPGVALSPTRDTIALTARPGMPPITEVSQPMLRLGGMRINPRNNGRHRAATGTALTLKTIATGAERKVVVPGEARIGTPKFSPDGRRIAFTNSRDSAIDLYIADVATAQARLVPGVAVNGLNNSCNWLDDSSALLCGFVPAGRTGPPAAPKIPAGPNVQESYGKAGPVRTYQDLLTSAHDEALFEYYLQSQMALVDAADGRVTPVGQPAMIASGAASPDGKFLLVTRLKRPFSRLLPSSEFPQDVEIWSRAGAAVRTVADVPMADTVPINGVIAGARSYRWIPVEPATLLWVEALDKGDPRNDVPHRDRIVTLKAPFAGEPSEVARTEFRYGGASWTEKGVVLLSESDRKSRTTRTWVLNPTWGERRKLWDRKQQDQYSHPGTPLMGVTGDTIDQFGDTIYLSGTGASKEGDRPFLDRLNLKTFQVERLFRSADASHETVAGLLTDDAKRVITRYETRIEPANYYVRELPAGTRTAITQFKDPHPQITKAMADRMFVTYQRKDGVGLSGTIYLPTGYQKGQRVPMLMWAYPREFVDADAASQVIGSPNRFTAVTGGSHLLLLAHGYAIFDGPTMPIVGPGETANDTYIEQLVSSAQAAADKAVELGIADRNRIGVGGHSYGAFMTANLLAHSDIFAAGVARSGAYNRTLTPFGFQAETRTYWEIPQVYNAMSPFNYSHKINEPILLIHGEADDNSGTFPVQSERLYMALKGHGATVRYVTLPSEAHGYAARESNMHVVAETINWLDKYVKSAGERRTTTR